MGDIKNYLFIKSPNSISKVNVIHANSFEDFKHF